MDVLPIKSSALTRTAALSLDILNSFSTTISHTSYIQFIFIGVHKHVNIKQFLRDHDTAADALACDDSLIILFIF